jgi:hypothetical protein
VRPPFTRVPASEDQQDDSQYETQTSTSANGRAIDSQALRSPSSAVPAGLMAMPAFDAV